MKQYLFDSLYDYDFNEYKAMLCEYNDIDPENITDSQVYDYINDIQTDDFYEIIKAIKKACNGHPVLFVGSVGTWGGIKYCGDYGNLEKLLNRLDGTYIQFYTEGKRLFVNSIHHDGNNIFEIKTLTPEGQRLADNWNYRYTKRYNFSEWELIEKLNKNYSRCIGGALC